MYSPVSSSSFQTILIVFQSSLLGTVVQANSRNLNESKSGWSNFSQVLTTQNPFPFISLSHDGETVVEPQLVAVDSFSEGQLACQNTINLLEGQTIQFRSPMDYSSQPKLRDQISVTCFNSPPGTNISIKCVDFSLNCNHDQFKISLGDISVPHDTRKFCGKGSISEQKSGSNKIKIIFGPGRGTQNNTSSPARFSCHVGSNSAGVKQFRSGWWWSESEWSSGWWSGCNCGQSFSTRIVGGVEAKPSEFPWRCFIQHESGFCGCTLISNKWVMTAAHCTENVKRLNVVLGAHILGSGAMITTVTSKRIINYPRYRRASGQDMEPLINDISLIELSRHINPSKEILPVCLPWNMPHWTFAGSTAVTSGWGSTSATGQASNTLRKVNLPVVSNQLCAGVLRNKVNKDMICGLHDERGVCSGDSGGSMDFWKNSRFYAIGITSWGWGLETCKNVFNRVTAYLQGSPVILTGSSSLHGKTFAEFEDKCRRKLL